MDEEEEEIPLCKEFQTKCWDIKPIVPAPVYGQPDTNTNHSCEYIDNKGLNPKPTHSCVV